MNDLDAVMAGPDPILDQLIASGGRAPMYNGPARTFQGYPSASPQAPAPAASTFQGYSSAPIWGERVAPVSPLAAAYQTVRPSAPPRAAAPVPGLWGAPTPSGAPTPGGAVVPSTPDTPLAYDAEGDTNPALTRSIVAAEGTARHGNPFDASLGYFSPPKPLSSMTMGQALQWGQKLRRLNPGLNSSAKGAFQIENSTQMDAMRALGIKANDPFNSTNQIRMRDWIVKHQGLNAWQGFSVHPDIYSQARAALSNGSS